jgi:hypothetical protein
MFSLCLQISSAAIAGMPGRFVFDNGQAESVFGAFAPAGLTFCFVSFFARLAIPARCFLVFCFVRLVFSIWE